MGDTTEFSRMIDIRSIDTRVRHLEANEAERAALAERFGIVSIGRLEADVDLVRDGTAVDASGRLSADIVQSCAVTGEDLPVAIREQFNLRFVDEVQTQAAQGEEVELEAEELDEIPFDGTLFDLGEAVAQSLALAIDPYATGPNADAVRKEAGLLDEQASGPFAALAALKGKKDRL
ncbi:MAG TPA: DUF177 domain-containing protein [Sphingomonadaceae bacterium]|nr:DUF177 domain-containing protein [Sphingomonadaceae bacterium]